jgi:hypothetical protein
MILQLLANEHMYWEGKPTQKSKTNEKETAFMTPKAQDIELESE